jgi:hypothetical protein
MGQDKIMDGDSRFSSSSFGSDKCLMAREENVISSTHTPIVTPSHHKLKNIDILINDDDDDVTAHDKLMKFCASTCGVSRSMFKYLMELIYEKEEAIIELNTLLEEEDRKSNLLEQELKIDKESIAIYVQTSPLSVTLSPVFSIQLKKMLAVTVSIVVSNKSEFFLMSMLTQI